MYSFKVVASLYLVWEFYQKIIFCNLTYPNMIAKKMEILVYVSDILYQKHFLVVKMWKFSVSLVTHFLL